MSRLLRKAASPSSAADRVRLHHDSTALGAVQRAFDSSAGRELDATTRALLEPGFGADLRGVRVHDDAPAASAARAIDARSFTFGRDVYFGTGEYAPASHEGRRLLAHELAHVIQQGAARRRSTDPEPTAQRRVRMIQRQPAPPTAPTAPVRAPSGESCDIRLCFLPLSLLTEHHVPPELAYAAANHVFIRFDGDSVGFTRYEGDTIRDAQVIRPEPRTRFGPERYERCVRARLRTIPTPTIGQMTSVDPLDSIGDMISYGVDVVRGVRHCSTPSCALARYRIERMLTDDRRGLYDLFDENCETWARKVLAAACMEAPEIRLGGVANIGGLILNESTIGRLYHWVRTTTGRTRPLPPVTPMPSPPAPSPTTPSPTIPAPVTTPAATPAAPLAPSTIHSMRHQIQQGLNSHYSSLSVRADARQGVTAVRLRTIMADNYRQYMRLARRQQALPRGWTRGPTSWEPAIVGAIVSQSQAIAAIVAAGGVRRGGDINALRRCFDPTTLRPTNCASNDVRLDVENRGHNLRT